ncbi:hypothetical protein DL93DRAFT_2077987 [Clavulina sp. PMI_390]|nr:hypothetical protein DL93DRAFT_2077987 [Clavulina sp. PMI_390]
MCPDPNLPSANYLKFTTRELSTCLNRMINITIRRRQPTFTSLPKSGPPISTLANASHAEVVRQSFQVIEDSETFDADIPTEFSFLCVMVTYDRTIQLLHVLNDTDFLSRCIAQAHELLPVLRGTISNPSSMDISEIFVRFFTAWYFLVAGALSTGDLTSVEIAIDSGILFVQEVQFCLGPDPVDINGRYI